MSLPASARADEVVYYSRLADQWWDADGPFWPLHGLNRFRTQILRDRIARHFGRDPDSDTPLAGLDVLDIGCGGGLLSEAIARLGANVTGVDVVERNIVIAQTHAADSGWPIDYRLQSVEALAATSRRFDVVLNMEVVEHVTEFDAFMANSARLVAPGGFTCVATINRTALAWLLAIVGAEYILRLLPRGTHRWADFRKPSEVESGLRQAGLAIDDRLGVRFNPFRRTFRVQDSLAVNYMLTAHRPQSPPG